MPAPHPSPTSSITLDELRALRGPVLLRGVLCLVFGLATVFWQPSNFWSWGDPGFQGVKWSLGAFLVLNGLCVFWLQRRLHELPEADQARTVLQSLAAVNVLGGAVAMVFAGQLVHLVLIVGLVNGLAGLLELLLGMRATGISAMATDWKLAGAVTVIAGAALFLFGEAGDKALFGIIGGAALIIGVFHVLAGLSFRHDVAALERSTP